MGYREKTAGEGAGPPRQVGELRAEIADTGALSAHRGAVRDLAGRSVEANPFFLPEFLKPALQALAPADARLILVWAGDRLVFFAPVSPLPASRILRAWTVWSHEYGPIGAPLIDAAAEHEACVAALTGLAAAGLGALVVPDLSASAPAAASLRRAGEALGGRARLARVAKRPLLTPEPDDPDAAFGRMLTKKRRKEQARQLRRLEELGGFELRTARGRQAPEAFRIFVELERSGWKGRRGTAMGQQPRIHDFAAGAVAALAETGEAEIDLLVAGGRPAAALIRCETGGLAVPWKIAFDESFATFSPGKQLMSQATRRWLADRRLVRVDPVCDAENRMLSRLWDRTTLYGALVLPTGRAGVTVPLIAAGLSGAGALRRAAGAVRDRVLGPRATSRER